MFTASNNMNLKIAQLAYSYQLSTPTKLGYHIRIPVLLIDTQGLSTTPFGEWHSI